MRIFHKLLAAALLFATIIDFSGCKKSDDPNNENGGNGSNPTTEGVYLGIIGFNESLFQKPISLLNSDSKEAFKSFIDGLVVDKGTGLYYADYTALKKLKAYSKPPQLKNVALVTFTDGLDNVSTSNSEMDPEGYGSISAYRTALHEKIMNETIHGYSVTAYTIGLRGQDVSDEQEFRTNLNMLASSPNNVFEVTNMNEALQRFSEIADALYSITVTSKVKIEVPGGYDEGQVIRFTFDNVTDGGNSNKYIQGTYKRTSDARLLENITYHGLSVGATSLSSISQSGAYYWFEFENLTHQNGNPISQTDINRLQLWKKQGSGWQRDAEFEPGTSTEVTEEKSSALIMLVLDCTTSLGDDFTKMKTGAKRFVETLASNFHNGNNGGSNGIVPEGAIDGLFSVSSYKKVYFSKGNLRYIGSGTNPYWKFADNQWDYLGNNGQSSTSHTINRDMFGWATSGYNHGGVCYQPWSTSREDTDYYAYGASSYNLYDQDGKADWGYNAITNGGAQTNQWRTLSNTEWEYVLFTRNTNSGIRFAKGKVNGKNGLILLPDYWDSSIYSLNDVNNSECGFNNIISSSVWKNTLESNGAVFLPAAGARRGTSSPIYVGETGYYWSSKGNWHSAYYLVISDGQVDLYSGGNRHIGASVRLVHDY